MSAKRNRDEFLISEQNILYYDKIAESYDRILDQESLNDTIRKKVESKFTSYVKPGRVLDFGGGTGRDLKWLTENRYNIIFCEPSAGMKENAIRYNENVLHNNNIVFLEKAKADFTHWHEELPFTGKVDAILMNFAVINCIPQIELLFRNLALLLKPGGALVALVLDDKTKGLISRLLNTIKSVLMNSPRTMDIKYKEHQQTVYVYTMKQIKIASRAYFNFYSRESFSEFGFILIHMIRK